jgi:phosphoenolpyruvate carboxykinase (GTP)
MVGRLDGRAGASEQLLGFSPRHGDIDWRGLAFSPERFNAAMTMDAGAWSNELDQHHQWFAQLQPRVPAVLTAIGERWRRVLAAEAAEAALP